jgi:hypothetical protein
MRRAESSSVLLMRLLLLLALVDGSLLSHPLGLFARRVEAEQLLLLSEEEPHFPVHVLLVALVVQLLQVPFLDAPNEALRKKTRERQREKVRESEKRKTKRATRAATRVPSGLRPCRRTAAR